MPFDKYGQCHVCEDSATAIWHPAYFRTGYQIDIYHTRSQAHALDLAVRLLKEVEECLAENTSPSTSSTPPALKQPAGNRRQAKRPSSGSRRSRTTSRLRKRHA